MERCCKACAQRRHQTRVANCYLIRQIHSCVAPYCGYLHVFNGTARHVSGKFISIHGYVKRGPTTQFGTVIAVILIYRSEKTDSCIYERRRSDFPFIHPLFCHLYCRKETAPHGFHDKYFFLSCFFKYCFCLGAVYKHCFFTQYRDFVFQAEHSQGIMGIRGHCNIYAIRLLFYQHFFITVISRLQAVFTCEGLRPFHGFTRNRRHLAVCDTVHRIAEFVCNISCPHYCKSEISHNNTSSVLLSCTNGHLFFLSDDNSLLSG